jgi:hypothetical protein
MRKQQLGQLAAVATGCIARTNSCLRRCNSCSSLSVHNDLGTGGDNGGGAIDDDDDDSDDEDKDDGDEAEEDGDGIEFAVAESFESLVTLANGSGSVLLSFFGAASAVAPTRGVGDGDDCGDCGDCGDCDCGGGGGGTEDHSSPTQASRVNSCDHSPGVPSGWRRRNARIDIVYGSLLPVRYLRSIAMMRDCSSPARTTRMSSHGCCEKS